MTFLLPNSVRVLQNLQKKWDSMNNNEFIVHKNIIIYTFFVYMLLKKKSILLRMTVVDESLILKFKKNRWKNRNWSIKNWNWIKSPYQSLLKKVEGSVPYLMRKQRWLTHVVGRCDQDSEGNPKISQIKKWRFKSLFKLTKKSVNKLVTDTGLNFLKSKDSSVKLK